MSKLTITLHFTQTDLSKLRFAISPLAEATLAMHTLADSRQHEHHKPWLKRAEDRLTDLKIDLLRALFPAAGLTPDFVLPAPGLGEAVLDDELKRLTSTPGDKVAVQLLNCLNNDNSPRSEQLIKRALGRPENAAAEVAESFQLVWTELIRPHWGKMRELLERDISYHATRIAERGIRHVIPELSGYLLWNDEIDSIELLSNHDVEIELGGAGLTLVPCMFAWPMPVVVVDTPQPTTLLYPARGVGMLWSKQDRAPNGALAGVLGRTRAQILGELIHPMTTSALARKYKMTPGGVSPHLIALRDAGLVTARRSKNAVLYECTHMGAALLGFAGV